MRAPALLKLPPLPPPRMAAVAPSRGYAGLPGRTLHAAGLTFADLARQVTLGLLEALTSGSIFKSPSLSGGGLRAGWYELRNRSIVLHGYSYVPGVTISGTISPGTGVAVGVGGSAAAHGFLRTSPHGAAIVGSLGGVRVRLPRGAVSTPASQAAGPRGMAGARQGELLTPMADALTELPGGSSYLAELPRLLSSRSFSAPPPTR
jgi:hypothetical protein